MKKGNPNSEGSIIQSGKELLSSILPFIFVLVNDEGLDPGAFLIYSFLLSYLSFLV